MNRSVSVITTFPPHKWEEYAKRMVEGFIWGWPEDISLTVYYEGDIPEDDWQVLYTQDKLFNLEEYHDSYLFWHLLKQHDLVKESFNISEGHPHKPGVHVFINSPLGKYMDHLKGSRKKQGKSKASDIYSKRNERYWKSIKG
jgi:hypothetical protein